MIDTGIAPKPFDWTEVHTLDIDSTKPHGFKLVVADRQSWEPRHFRTVKRVKVMAR